MLRPIVLFFLILVSCKVHDSSPELKDPIYSDILRQGEEVGRDIADLQKQLEEAKKGFESAGLQNGEIKMRRNSIFEITAKIDLAQQKSRYLEFKAERRKAFARRSYEKTFEKDEPWPDPKELRVYQVNKKLMATPRSYDQTHRERLEARAPASKNKKEAKPAASPAPAKAE